jgi:hypothetical protein
MAKQNDLSRCLVTLEQDATVIAVIEIGQSSWLVAGIVPGLEPSHYVVAARDCRRNAGRSAVAPGRVRTTELLQPSLMSRPSCKLMSRAGGNPMLDS